jgi:YggT family protein
MFAPVFLTFLELFVLVYNVLLLARVVMSWVAPHMDNPLVRLLHELTEPVLAPIRRMVPLGGLDVSPIVAYFLLQGLLYVARRLLLGA